MTEEKYRRNYGRVHHCCASLFLIPLNLTALGFGVLDNGRIILVQRLALASDFVHRRDPAGIVACILSVSF